MSKQHWFAIAN